MTPEQAVGYMRPRLENLRDRGIVIESLLDIGAAHGHFAKFFRTIWPNSSVTALECNERDRKHLDQTNFDVRYVCLGAEPCTKTFYINPDEPDGGGSSFYREGTVFFDSPLTEDKAIVTLDSLDLGPHDFVKLDVQGAELDVIEGGRQTIEAARYALLEMSFAHYNPGSPLIDDILPVMRAMGFRMIDTFGPHEGGHLYLGQKVQVDVLFAKETEPVFSLVVL